MTSKEDLDKVFQDYLKNPTPSKKDDIITIINTLLDIGNLEEDDIKLAIEKGFVNDTTTDKLIRNKKSEKLIKYAIDKGYANEKTAKHLINEEYDLGIIEIAIEMGYIDLKTLKLLIKKRYPEDIIQEALYIKYKDSLIAENLAKRGYSESLLKKAIDLGHANTNTVESLIRNGYSEDIIKHAIDKGYANTKTSEFLIRNGYSEDIIKYAIDKSYANKYTASWLMHEKYPYDLIKYAIEKGYEDDHTQKDLVKYGYLEEPDSIDFLQDSIYEEMVQDPELSQESDDEVIGGPIDDILFGPEKNSKGVTNKLQESDNEVIEIDDIPEENSNKEVTTESQERTWWEWLKGPEPDKNAIDIPIWKTLVPEIKKKQKPEESEEIEEEAEEVIVEGPDVYEVKRAKEEGFDFISNKLTNIVLRNDRDYFYVTKESLMNPEFGARIGSSQFVRLDPKILAMRERQIDIRNKNREKNREDLQLVVDELQRLAKENDKLLSSINAMEGKSSLLKLQDIQMNNYYGPWPVNPTREYIEELFNEVVELHKQNKTLKKEKESLEQRLNETVDDLFDESELFSDDIYTEDPQQESREELQEEFEYA